MDIFISCQIKQVCKQTTTFSSELNFKQWKIGDGKGDSIKISYEKEEFKQI